ncbi:hypothetical protein CYY_000435 [Polysphondylium violaceum]|uniref:Leucine carboxyl methyltransferase 1 n=1 Tax=Polysphondylium violaceum TaxID=133409 RepID=A0A8J4Q2S8_9MYCE|nr:hypothetical protein CYY_000435 [Polysphondylium violaceum]
MIESSDIETVLECVGKTGVWMTACRAVITSHYIANFNDDQDQEINHDNEINKRKKEFELKSMEILKKKKDLINLTDKRMEIKYPTKFHFDPYSLYFISQLDTKDLILKTYDHYFNTMYDKEYKSLDQETKSLSRQELRKRELDKIENNFHSVLSWTDLMGTHIYYGVALRTHLIDQVFLDSYQHGIKQFVLFGSGLDTRAFRLALDSECTIFEIDLPGVIQFKKTAFREAIYEIPRASDCQVKYIPCDLLKQDWIGLLKQSGFESNKPTLWISEGLFQYLNVSAIESIGQQVQENSAPQSKYFIQTLMKTAPDAPPYPAHHEDALKMRANTVADEFQFTLLPDAKEYLIKHGFSSNIQQSFEMAEGFTSLYSFGSNQ